MGATAVAQESPSAFQPKAQAQPGDWMMGVIDFTEVASFTSETKHQAQPGNSMKGTIDLTEKNPSAPQSEDQAQNDPYMGEL